MNDGRRLTWLVAGLALGSSLLALAACGSSSNSNSSTSSSTAASSAPAVAAPGTYKAHLSTKQIDAQGVQSIDIGGGGIWTLNITPTTITWKGALASNPTVSYKIVSSKKGSLTLAGNPECSVHSARTQQTTFKVESKDGGLAFTPVHIACKEDGGVIAAGVWKKS
jgi:hypothetical protein